MKAIGGFLELESPRGDGEYHRTDLAFKNGRAAFNAILMQLKPGKVLVPYYCCDSLLQPLVEGGFRYEFYALDTALEPETLPALAADELFLYVDYFDLKRRCVTRLTERYGRQLIVDATQAFFLKGDGRSWLFDSCRKFFGVPDGSYLYTPSDSTVAPPAQANTDYLIDHLILRAQGDLARAYPLSQRNEALMDARLTGMSAASKALLSHVDYAAVAQARRSNFLYLQQRLRHLNTLQIAELDPGAVPHYFPLLPRKPIEKQRFWEKQIFMPGLWPECLTRPEGGFTQERLLASQLLPLPIDQRYTQDDMDRVADRVLELCPAT